MSTPRWSRADAEQLFELPFADLVFRAQGVHRAHFDANEVQISQLLSIKTGGCPEDCGYCSQSAHADAAMKGGKLIDVEEVVRSARAAKEEGAQRFCMGAAWRSPKDRDMDAVCEMVERVKGLGLETCMTLGMLSDAQAQRLADAGLDYYNHNIDTSPEYYATVVRTRTMQDRLETLERVRNCGIHVCSGGIIGMGESRADRVGMLVTLANLPEPPDSVPINALMRVKGTRLASADSLDPFEFVRTIAAARIMIPGAVVRLSAGREAMSDELQSLCFLAGANSIFVGDKLLTTKNPGRNRDASLFARLGIRPMGDSDAQPSSCASHAPDAG